MLEKTHNTALQTDERRAAFLVERKLAFAPLAAERQRRWAAKPIAVWTAV